MKASLAWPLLAKKANEALNKVLLEKKTLRERMQHLQDSRVRMLKLYDDYKQRAFDTQKELHSVQQMTGYRHYMVQIQDLVRRVDEDIAQVRLSQEQAEQREIKAEQHLMRMQSLVERDVQAIKRHERQQDQKQMDALGLTLYNLKG